MDIFIPCKNDREYNLASYLKQNTHNCTVLPKTNLEELKSLISKADLVLGADCAVTYFGWAANRPTLILYQDSAPNTIYENDYCRCVNSAQKTLENIYETIDELIKHK